MSSTFAILQINCGALEQARRVDRVCSRAHLPADKATTVRCSVIHPAAFTGASAHRSPFGATRCMRESFARFDVSSGVEE